MSREKVKLQSTGAATATDSGGRQSEATVERLGLGLDDEKDVMMASMTGTTLQILEGTGNCLVGIELVLHVSVLSAVLSKTILPCKKYREIHVRRNRGA